MKISKLFHWLYAILMFLPIMVFIPNAFYYGFNEQAVAQEKTEQVPVYYPTNSVNNNDDIIINNVYYFTDNFRYQNDTDSTIDLLSFYFLDNSLNNNININNACSMYISNNQNSLWISYTRLDNGTTGYMHIGDNRFPIKVNQKYNYSYLLVNYLQPISIIKEYQPLVTDMSITDSMSYAWKSTWQNELFSWSYGSFLTQPFLYITNLFNVPATNTLLYCLSYWLNISIIWLCFDVVMYVPLLVHRWLDKGIVE